MAKVVQTPELRYTQDNQTPVTEMLVEFASDRDGDPPAQLQVVGWGNLASEMQQSYQEGDNLIIEGRLSMRNIDKDGYKEKKAELRAARIYRIDGEGLTASTPKPSTTTATPTTPMPVPVASEVGTSDLGNLDDIPF